MPTFRNTSDKVFVDGNITVLPTQVWTVDDPARIEQLTNQYGWQFENTESPQGAQKTSVPSETTKSLSKMNRAELEAVAADIGLEVTEDMDTNKKLKDAIEAQQRVKEAPTNT